MYIKGITSTVRYGNLVLSMCLLLVFLNGCAVFRQKQVTPPPSRSTVSPPPAEAPGTPGKKRPPVVKTPREDRYVVPRPPVGERPLTTKPPVEERSVVTRPPVDERPIATEPPIEERPIETRPPVEEQSAVTGPPVEEPSAATESPADYKPVTGKAAAIFNEAEEALQAGNYSSAELLLERALRIEPRNAHYWYILGLAKFRQKQYAQTVQFCLKAESLAGSQPGLMARNRVLLTQAKKAAGMQ